MYFQTSSSNIYAKYSLSEWTFLFLLVWSSDGTHGPLLEVEIWGPIWADVVVE